MAADSSAFAPRRLLVPLDGSRLAEAVLPVVERLAAAFGAAIVLLHVRERGAPQTVHGERHLTEVGSADSYLSRIVDGLRARGLTATSHVHDVPEGDVAASI